MCQVLFAKNLTHRDLLVYLLLLNRNLLMNISAEVNRTIDNIPPGKLFGYEVFAEYLNSPNAVIRAVGRRVEKGRLIRVEKGIFYTPKQGIFGKVPVSDAQLVQNYLVKNGRRVGYFTGAALYNRLGLSTQLPKTFDIAWNRSPQTKDFGTIQIRLVPNRAPITESTVPMLETLDVLKNVKKIQGARVEWVLEMTARRLRDSRPPTIRRLQKLAVEYYNAGTRALLGVLLTRNRQEVLKVLSASINPTSRFHIGLDSENWPEAHAWNVR